MGQIVLRNQDYTYCNLQAIQAGGSQANTVLDLGEVWIIDSTNASKTNGSGKYDKYIVGDGSTVAKNLTIYNIDDDSSLDILVEDYSKQYFTTVALESGTISFNIWKSMGTNMITSISYSTDNGETWNTTNNTNGKTEHLVITVNVNKGNKVMWKGDAQQLGYYDEDDYSDTVGSFFSSTCEFDAQGNVMSLLYDDNFKGETTIEKDYAFACLFSDYDKEKTCGIVNAKDLSLPATTLASYCYQIMFYGCTNLTTPPALPATTLASSCYSNMFNGCTSLTNAPELPATTLANGCYGRMFEHCTSLTTAPVLPATTLANGCYSTMFIGCRSLTTAPKLPATTLADSCYSSMFSGCTSLTTAPELPATTLAYGCYRNMFYNCTSLTTAPELPATTLADGCYSAMFEGCIGLNYIKAMFTTTPSGTYTQNWVSGVAASGTFVKNAAATWTTTGVNGIPEGWNIYTESEYEVVRHYELNESELAISAALNDLNSRTSLTEITWVELKELRDNSNLVPGKQYRITDYVTTTSQTNTRSAGHAFDILVMAMSANKLSEIAFAMQHSGDMYFANSNLAAWELKYRLDNDTDRFAWADSTNGKGVIFYMKDEWNNECPYDFKNIQFLKSSLYYYTFDLRATSDYSLNGRYCYGNIMKPYYVNGAQNLNANIFKNTSSTSNCFFNTFGDNCYSNIFESNCYSNTFKNNCSHNYFGDNCSYNTFKNNCSNNTFNNNCYYNTFGYNCHSNNFGDSSSHSIFGYNCFFNTFKNNCFFNTFGDNCFFNTFEDSCYSNTFKNNCSYNTFEDSCSYNIFESNCGGNTLDAYTQKYIQIGDIIIESGIPYYKLDGQYHPVVHPSISTQPSLLAYNFGTYPMYEVASRIDANGTLIDLPSNAKVVESTAIADGLCLSVSLTKTSDTWSIISDDLSKISTLGFTCDFVICKYYTEGGEYYYYS